MTWIIIVGLILVVLFVISNQNHNKTVEEHYLNQGGFRKSFSTFTNHLENFYNMSFVNDTGRLFSYSKEINDTNGNKGNLVIGIKLDMRDGPIIFTKFQSKYKGEFHGIDVSGANFSSIESIDKCISISIDKIKTQGILDYQDKNNNIISHSVPKEFINDWNQIGLDLSHNDMFNGIDIYINSFFIPDLVDSQKFMENFDILCNSWKALEENYGTISIREILYIPPALTPFFLAAYPDVYQWYKKNANTGKIEIDNKIEKFTDEEVLAYFDNAKCKIEFYRSLINQYKREGNLLETNI